MKTSRPKHPPQPLIMGDYRPSRDDLLQMTKEVSKDQHFITESDLDPNNGMNYNAVKKYGNSKVETTLLKYIPDSKGTAKYLWIARKINVVEMLSFEIHESFILPRWQMSQRSQQEEKEGYLPSDETIEKIINVARQDAIGHLNDVGIKVREKHLNMRYNYGVDDQIDSDEEDEEEETHHETSEYVPDDEVDVPELSDMIPTIRESFSLQDYSAVSDSSKTACNSFKVKRGGSQILVKKSTFIWMCSDQAAPRITSDRYHRFNKSN
ncbi:hypothetical protein DMENIID0001_149220 [Sergentomyia squamirostris]